VQRGSTLVTALHVTLARPSTWPLALGAFLLRGGLVLVLLPIVVVPTPVGIGNLLAPALNAISLGAIPLGFVLVCAGIGIAVVLWLGLAGWLAGMLEAAGVRIVAEAAGPSPEGGRQVADGRVANKPSGVDGSGVSASSSADATDELPNGRDGARILACRLVCLVPLAIALAIGSVRLVFVTYQELVLPSDTATPIAIRVLGDAPEVPIAILVIWMSAEIIAAVAARRVVLAGDGVSTALRSAIGSVGRRPLHAIWRFWLPTIAAALVVVAAGVASSSAWTVVKDTVGGSANPVAALVATVAFVGLWFVGLMLIAVVSAWRAAVWTVAATAEVGTFGGSTDRRPGDWRPDPRSATL
jgi:hypothetical protein